MSKEKIEKAPEIKIPPCFELTVTEKVAAIAEPYAQGKCLIAENIRQKFPGQVTSIAVADGHVSFNLNGWRYKYPLPAKAIKMLEEFDNTDGACCEEFIGMSYKLDGRFGALMQQVQKRGSRSTRRVDAGKKRTRKPGVRKSCIRRYRAVGSSAIVEAT